ncbi:MAG TPA: DUF4145 domain-containing protein [Stellaceae bacterium]|jgi:hypothetical protein|nr:DUF4145 domain-containing protein [Stellaceae bacterium]
MSKFDELRQIHEQWKKDTLYGKHTPEEIDYLKLDREREKQRERDRERGPTGPRISLDARYEGIYVCGRPGSGKTQLLQERLLPDLDIVAAGKAAVVAIDPTGDVGGDRPSLIHVLTRLKRFAHGGDLYNRLIYIDPLDEDYYLPVNLFNLRPTDDNARAISAVITNYVQIMDGLLGQPLTGFQDPIFRWAVQVALAFPHPNLQTLVDVLAPTPAGQQPIYEEVFDRLEPAVQNYLRRLYETQGRIASREQILSRLESLNADPLFRQMFNGRRTSINFHRLINEPNVIVLNLSRDLGSMRRLYTRYFMAQLYNAGERRPANPLPCFVYIDECDEIVDHTVGDMLRKLRRNKVALTLANQETARIPEDAREAVTGVAVKFINARIDSARELGANMGLSDGAGRVDTSLLVNRPAFSFAFHATGMREPISYSFQPFKMNKLPTMTEDEWKDTLRDIRERYYEPINQKPAPPSVIEEIAERSPSAAIVEMRRTLENAIRSKLMSLNLPGIPRSTKMVDMIRILGEHQCVDDRTRDVLHRLRLFGNKTAHNDQPNLTIEAAIEYGESVERVVKTLNRSSSARLEEKQEDPKQSKPTTNWTKPGKIVE